MTTSISNPRLDSVLGALGGLSPAGPEETVLQLFDDYHTAVYRYARSFGLDTCASEDVAQEVFLALVRHVFRGGARTNLTGWIFRVAHNLALKRRTHEQRRARLTVFAPRFSRIDPTANAEEQMMADERQSRLQAVVMALPERDRQCLLLRAEGLRYREIACALGVSLGTVATSMARVLARLRRADGG